MDLVIKNGIVTTANETKVSDIYINEEKIADIKEPAKKYPDGIKIIDASNKIVIPGGVDVHTHLDMPFMGTRSTDDFETGSIAAAFGGVTTLIDYIIPQKNQSPDESVKIWNEKAKSKAIIDYGFHMAVIPPVDNFINNMDFLVKEGITSIKCFLAYKDALMIDDGSLFKLLQKAKEYGILVCIHAENGEIIDILTKQYLENGNTEPIYHAFSRPSELEGESTARVIKLAKMTGTPVYFVHLSSREALKEIKRAKKGGQNIYAETCPQYILLSEEKYFESNFEGAKYVMSPPLRNKSHLKALKKAIKNSFIDVIATDHCPFNFNTEKQSGLKDFTKIPNGAPGIETRLPLMYNEMVVKMGMSVNDFVKLNCTRPAEIFGLKNKGDIAVGKDADIVIWNPDYIWRIKQEALHQNVDYTPFENKVVTGKAVTVISRGEVIIEEGWLKAQPGRGQYIRRAINKL